MFGDSWGMTVDWGSHFEDFVVGLDQRPWYWRGLGQLGADVRHERAIDAFEGSCASRGRPATAPANWSR